MAAATGSADIKLRIWDGLGIEQLWLPLSNGTITAAAAASGFFTNSLNPNAIGSTLPTTIQGFPLPNTTNDLRLTMAETAHNATDSFWLARFYRFGNATLTATGNRLTHDGTFTRLRRTVFGTANTAINLIPVMYITTATAAAAAVFTMTYADQDGVSTTGPNNTLPAAATAAQGLYNILMDVTDYAVLDVTAITLSGSTPSAGACDIYGVELLAPFNSVIAGAHSYVDLLFSGLTLPHLQPAVPDSGSVTSFLAVYCPSNLSTGVCPIRVQGFDNT